MSEETVDITITVNAEERETFINDVVLNVDLFMRGYCGYWLFGAHWDAKKRERLVFECDDDPPPTDSQVRKVLKQYRADGSLPERWFILNRAVAERAYSFLVARIGAEDTGDASDYDVAVQRALLGEVRYG
jgi:hypothetical protein